MDDYDSIIKSSLKLKGHKKVKDHKSKPKKRKQPEEHTAGLKDELKEDAKLHGNWWKVTEYPQIKGDVAIEFVTGCYARALDNGRIVLGDPHPPGEPPDEEEIFTSICSSTSHVSLKSGFGRYLNVDSRQRLMGLSEVIGDKETFLPVFEEGKTAICAYNDLFIGPDRDQPQIVAKSTTVEPEQMLTIRVCNNPTKFK